MPGEVEASCGSEGGAYRESMRMKPQHLDPRTERFGLLRLLFCVLLVSITSPGVARAQDDVEVASWLAGRWMATVGEVRSDEVWMEPDGGMMVGMARTVRGDAATGYELVVLHRKDGRR